MSITARIPRKRRVIPAEVTASEPRIHTTRFRGTVVVSVVIRPAYGRVEGPSVPGGDGSTVARMRLRKGMRVRELTRKASRLGRVIAVRGTSVEVQWDDGHRSSVTGGYLIPIHREHPAA